MIAIEDSLDVYLKDVSKYPVLSREEERNLFERLTNGEEEAREQIVKCNLRFVVKMALRYQGQGVGLADLIQEGNMGLIEVVDKFDHTKGFRFSTYAAFWIKQAIQQALCRQSRLIRLPVRKSRMIGRISEAAKTFAKRESREPTLDELAAMVDMPVDRVEQLTRLNEPAVSLGSAIAEGGPTLEELLPQKQMPGPREEAIDQQMKRRVHQAMDRLSERERRILKLRFGFSGKKALSLRSTSAFVGLSQEGVRRVEKKALEKMSRGAFQTLIAGLI